MRVCTSARVPTPEPSSGVAAIAANTTGKLLGVTPPSPSSVSCSKVGGLPPAAPERRALSASTMACTLAGVSVRVPSMGALLRALLTAAKLPVVTPVTPAVAKSVSDGAAPAVLFCAAVLMMSRAKEAGVGLSIATSMAPALLLVLPAESVSTTFTVWVPTTRGPLVIRQTPVTGSAWVVPNRVVPSVS